MAQFTVSVVSKDGETLFTQVEAASLAQALFAQEDLQRFAGTQTYNQLWADPDFFHTREGAELRYDDERMVAA